MLPLKYLFLLIIMVILLFIFVVIYRRILLQRKITNSGFPILPSSSFLLSGLSLLKSGETPWLLRQFTAKYGKTYGFMCGAYPFLVTSDIDLIEQICIKNFSSFHSRMIDPFGPDPDHSRNVHVFAARGDRWKRIRSLTSYAFTHQNLQKLFPIMRACIKNFIRQLEKEANSATPIEIHRRLQTLTFDVISQCCFDWHESEDIKRKFLDLLLEAFAPVQQFNRSSLTAVVKWCLPELSGIHNFLNSVYLLARALNRHTPIISTLDQLIMDIVRKNVEITQDCHDFLQILKQSESDEWNDWQVGNGTLTKRNINRTNRKILFEEIAAQCRFLTLAGFDTTANTLAYAFYLLAERDDVQETLRNEIDKEDDLNFHSILRIDYLHWVISETLRLYPHATMLHSRQCMEDCVINGHRFRKGLNVIFDTWSLHQDTEIWGSDANEFNPERFNTSQTAQQMKSWIPFGNGSRQCIGMRFALLEIKTTICFILKKFQVRVVNAKNVRLRLRESGTVWPDSLKIILEPRVALSSA